MDDRAAVLEHGDTGSSNYGALKALCEHAAEAAMPGRVTNVRPGLIIGPGDMTGRFTHWPTRLADGGEVLAPGDGQTPVQYIDARDLGAWLVLVVEDSAFGTMNALGPATRTTMRDVLTSCDHAVGDKAQLTWVDAAFLAEHGIEGWRDLPMWIDNHGESAGRARGPDLPADRRHRARHARVARHLVPRGAREGALVGHQAR